MIEIEKNLIGKEDIIFGVGTVTQQRGGKSVTITKINTAEMPYDKDLTLAEKLQEVVEGNVIDDTQIALDKTYSSAKIQQIDDDQQIQIDANQQNIANLATAQAEFGSSTPLVLTTSEQILDWDILVPSTDTNVMTLDDVTNSQILKLNASFNYKTDMEFAIDTNQARLITVRGRKLSDDSLIYERSVTVDSNNGSTETIHTNKLLTVGKNGIPPQPLDIYFTIQCNGTGITLNNWSSNLASGASYDLTTISKFTELLDTPNSYNGQAGKYPRVNNTEDGLEFGSSLSTTACSLLLTGTVTIDNTIPTKGGLTHPYTGTGASNPLNLGVGFIDFTVAFNGSGYWLDRSAGYGNEVFRNDAGVVQDLTNPILIALPVNKYVGKFEIKGRDTSYNHETYDGLRGVNNIIYSSSSVAEFKDLTNNRLTNFTATGVTLGSDEGSNQNTKTYVLHAEVYTHIKASLVNGNLQVVAWNPITKMGMSYRLGSNSIANADRPFKVDYQETKRLNGTEGGVVYYGDKDGFLRLYSPIGANASEYAGLAWGDGPTGDIFTFETNNSSLNIAGGVYVDYFFANSEYKKLVNYIGTGVGTEAISGFKPSVATIKCLNISSDWRRFDNKRANDGYFISLNTSGIEYTVDDRCNFTNSGLIFPISDGALSTDTYQYIAIIEADTNKNNGGIIFPFVTDDNNLLVTNGGYIHTDGKNLDGSFNKKSEIVFGTQSFDLTGVSDGKKYLAREYGTGASNNYVLKAYDGYSVGLYDKESADDNRLVFDVESGEHYETVGGELLTNGKDFISTAGWTAVGTSIFTTLNGNLHFKADGVTNEGGVRTVIPTEIGKTYKLQLNIEEIAGLGGRWYIKGVNNLDTPFGIVNLITASTFNTYDFEFVANDTSYTLYINEYGQNFTTECYISLVSVFKKQATLGTPLDTPISFISRYPYMVVSETPQYEMVNEKAIPVNVMDSLSVDIIEASRFVGKNACTAWVNFDGTTIPPTIRDSFNISDVVRTATGKYDIYFDRVMDLSNYSVVSTSIEATEAQLNGVNINQPLELQKFSITCKSTNASAFALQDKVVMIHIFGGKQ